MFWLLFLVTAFVDIDVGSSLFGNLDEFYAGLKEATKKLKLDYEKVVT